MKRLTSGDARAACAWVMAVVAFAPAVASAAGGTTKYPWNIPDNVRVVQKAPVDGVRTFATIQSAIDSITGATATNRFVVQVMPGTYVESVNAKQYVDIAGSGAAVTVIEDAGTAAAISATTANFAVRDLTIVQHAQCGVSIGTTNDTVVLRNVTVKMPPAGYAWGICQDAGKLEVHDSRIEWIGTAGAGAEAIYGDTVLVSKTTVEMTSSSDFEGIVARNPTVRDSVVSLTCAGSCWGVMVNGGAGRVVNSDITVRSTGSSDGGSCGVSAFSSSVTIQASRIEVTTAAPPTSSSAVLGTNIAIDGSVLSGAAWGLDASWGGTVSATVNNSNLSGLVAVRKAGSGARVTVGGSRLSGGHDLVPGVDKVVNCYDGTFDPIPNQ